MNSIKIIIGFIGLSLAFYSCQEDYLERYPLDEVSEAVFFKTPNDLKIYMNQFYNKTNFPLSTSNARDRNMDTYIIETEIDARLQGTRTVASGSALNYTTIRSINYFFANYKKCEADFKDYKQYVGEAHFFRAKFYFDLLRNFGDVPWITKVLETNSPELYGARTPRNIVADNIIADLDSAVMYLTEDKTNGCSRINKWMAFLLQSRIALYEGTWEKYHAGDPFGVSGSQPAKYFNKTVEAAMAVMNSGKYDIYSTGKPSSDYVDLFGLQDYSTNKEVLFWSKMSATLGVYSINKLYILESPAGIGLTKSMADSYLCTDGQPIATSPLFGGSNSILDEMKHRDPRFYQTIFTPDSPWKIETNGITRTWNEVYTKLLFSNTTYACPTGYVQRKEYIPNMIYHSQNYDVTPSIQYRYSEVLLNFIEAKAELGTIIQSDIDISIKKIRDRVGMPNLLLNNIVSDPNWEFPNLSSVINEIRRERKVELVLENFRWDDIARWAAADELIVGKRPKGGKASQFAIAPAYTIDDNGFIDPFRNALPNGYGFVITRDYLNPISENEIILNPELKQNPGW